MLHPIMTESRLLIDLCGLWDFRLEKKSNMIHMPVPASCKDFRILPEFQNHHGWIIYQKNICLPEMVRNQRVVIRFESVLHKAKIWLNQELIKEHDGGFLPFETEITNLLKPGENLLMVETDDPMSGHSDHSDMIGPVKLYTTPRDYIIDVELNAQIDKKDAFVSYNVRTHGNGSVKVEIFDREGISVAHAVGMEGRLEIPDVNLWQPLAAYLYQVKITFAKDVYILPYGVRTVQIKEGQFLVNEKPFYFKGYTSEDTLPTCNRWDVTANRKDLALLKWQNVNSLWVFPHSYSEEMIRLCDMEGMILIEEFSAEEMRSRPDVMRDIVSRDKNYACVVLWSLENDTDFNSAELLEQIRKEDPQRRPCTVSDMRIFDVQDVQKLKIPDVVCLNCFKMNESAKDLKAVKEKLHRELEFLAIQGKPVLCMGYGTEAILGVHDIISDTYTEEYQIVYLKAVHKILDRFSCVIGEIISVFADDMADNDKLYVQGSHKGIFTKERKPKLSAYYLRSRWKKISDFEWKK